MEITRMIDSTNESPMFLPKANLAVVKAASSDACRLAINTVLIEADGATVATDGHILVKVGAIPANKMATPLKPCLLSRDDAMAIAKALPKKGTPAEIDVDATNLNGHIAVKVGTATHAPLKTDMQFPDYGQVYPKEAPSLTIGFSIDLMLRTLTTLKDAGVKSAAFNFTDALSPLHITATNDAEQAVSALVMPWRLK